MKIHDIVSTRRVWRYQRCNHNTMAKRKSTKGQTTIYKTYT